MLFITIIIIISIIIIIIIIITIIIIIIITIIIIIITIIIIIITITYYYYFKSSQPCDTEIARRMFVKKRCEQWARLPELMKPLRFHLATLFFRLLFCLNQF